jgi:hypothetical protein
MASSKLSKFDSDSTPEPTHDSTGITKISDTSATSSLINSSNSLALRSTESELHLAFSSVGDDSPFVRKGYIIYKGFFFIGPASDEHNPLALVPDKKEKINVLKLLEIVTGTKFDPASFPNAETLTTTHIAWAARLLADLDELPTELLPYYGSSRSHILSIAKLTEYYHILINSATDDELLSCESDVLALDEACIAMIASVKEGRSRARFLDKPSYLSSARASVRASA